MSNDGDIIIKKFLVRIKDEENEHLFTKQVDAVANNVLTSSHRHYYTDVRSSRDRDNFAVSHANEDSVETVMCHQDELTPSKCAKEESSLAQYHRSAELIMYSEGGSNV